jgi:hypothetical protein
MILFSYLCSYEWWVIISLFESSYEGYAMITIPEPKGHPPYNVFSDII